MSACTTLRHELSARNQQYAQRTNLPNLESRGQPPVICYLPTDDGRAHGTFLPETYRAILKNKNWARRLTKAHTSAREALPRIGRRWCELDSSNSSDALLMNIFCFPGILTLPGLPQLLGMEMELPGDGPTAAVQFGVKGRVPLRDSGTDRTEVDMQVGDLLVEAKLTESDFQTAPVARVENYRDLSEVFDPELLPRAGDHYVSYQLIRNVLAAHANQCAFCVMLDARRPDLREAWYQIIRSTKILDLRLRCKLVTWQELAVELPRRLQIFLEEKYGIVPPGARHPASGA